MLLEIFHDDHETALKIERYTLCALDYLGINVDELILRFEDIYTDHAKTPMLDKGAAIAGTIFTNEDGIYEIMVNTRVKHTGLQAVFLCHELIHLRQGLTGRLRHVEDGFIWENEFYPLSHPYRERPWEIEAFNLESETHANIVALLEDD